MGSPFQQTSPLPAVTLKLTHGALVSSEMPGPGPVKRSGLSQTWFQFSALSLTCCVTVALSLPSSKMETILVLVSPLFEELNDIMHIKCSV